MEKCQWSLKWRRCGRKKRSGSGKSPERGGTGATIKGRRSTTARRSCGGGRMEKGTTKRVKPR